jgi:hypothetical protein
VQDQPKRGQQLILIHARGSQLQTRDHRHQQLASLGASVGDQQVEVPRRLRAGDAAGPGEILA